MSSKLPPPPVCEWTYNEDYSYFDGTCGAAWCFEHIGPDEVPSKTLRYCPTCGNQILKVTPTQKPSAS